MRVSWEIKKLGSVCENLDSQRKPITQRNRILGEIPYYGATGIVDYVKDYLFDEKLVLLGEDGAKWSSGDECAFMIEGKTWVNNHAHVLRPNRKLILDEWLIYNLNFQDLSPYITGMTVPKLNQGKMNEIRIPIPPLPEQKRIVAILDEAFAAIDKAKANTLKNLQNAKELFESYLQGVFENKGEGWEEKKLIDVTKKIGSGATPLGGEKSYKSNGISLIRSLNVYDNDFRKKDLAFIDEKQASKLNNVTIEEDDVLFNITGASVARCCLVPIEVLPARVNQHVSIVRSKKDIVVPKFIQLSLTARVNKNKLLKVGEQGATRQAITKAQLEEFVIQFPTSLNEQKQTIYKIELALNKTRQIESIYKQKLDDLEELKKSILQKAFSGELTEKTVLV